MKRRTLLKSIAAFSFLVRECRSKELPPALPEIRKLDKPVRGYFEVLSNTNIASNPNYRFVTCNNFGSSENDINGMYNFDEQHCYTKVWKSLN